MAPRGRAGARSHSARARADAAIRQPHRSIPWPRRLRAQVDTVTLRCGHEPVFSDHERGPDSPPSDHRAEQVVLNHCLIHPADVLTLGIDLEGLCFWEHRVIWAQMLRIVQQHPDIPGGLLEVELIKQGPEIQRLLRLLDPFARDYPENCPECRDLRWQPPLSWWVARVKRCAEARRQLSILATVSAHLWRVPDDDVDLEQSAAAIDECVPEPIPFRPRPGPRENELRALREGRVGMEIPV